jgi:polyisoprenoid-binding protein YceI
MLRTVPIAALLTLALALGAAPAPAQTPKPADTGPPTGPFLQPDQIPAGTYGLDSKEDQVRYTTLHMGLTEFSGIFPNANGTLIIDPKAIEAAKVDIKIPVWGLETTNRELNAELISGEFFDFAKFRSIRFVSTAVTRTGTRTARMTGDLTVHGVTRPVTLNVTFNNAGPNSFSKVLTLGFKAEGMVKRSDFGIAKYVPIVSDETQITISAAFEQQK